MNKQRLADEIKKRRTSPHISNSYGDLASLSDLLIAAFNKEKKYCCSNPNKYRNGIGKMLFWSCKNCGADLGDVND
jgi:hypothetical protein